MKNQNAKTANRVKYGLNLKENLPEFVKKLVDDYHRYAGIQFAIYDYSLYELCRDGQDEAKDLTKQFRRITEGYISGTAEDAALLEDLKALRNSVIDRMEAVSAYTDIFTVFEYIINRMELKFLAPEDDFDDDEEARDILSRLFAGSDNSVTNLRIQTMLSQLPVRMTRAKFMDVLEDSMALYEGSEQTTVQRFLYMVRSAAGLYRPDCMKEFPELAEDLKRFEASNFKEMQEAEYLELCDQLEEISTTLNQYSEYFSSLAEVINQLYILLLTRADASEEAKKDAAGMERLTGWIAEHFSEEAFDEIPEDLVEEFQMAEGELERLSGAVARAEGAREGLLDRYYNELKELGLDHCAEYLEDCSSLITSSLFVRLDEEESIEIADRAYIEKEKKQLQSEFDALFNGREQKQVRAIMAAVLKELPVFFSSRNDVMEYVRYALENCRDYSEKRISVDLLYDALEEIDVN